MMSDTQMTTQERQFLYDAVAGFTEHMFDPHYTFKYDNTTRTLFLVKNPAAHCHTRHCSTVQELLIWYKDELKKDESITICEYATFFHLDENIFRDMALDLIDDIELNKPELLV